jgi:hypothetical protein
MITAGSIVAAAIASRDESGQDDLPAAPGRCARRLPPPGDGRGDHPERTDGRRRRPDEREDDGRLRRAPFGDIALEDGQQAGRYAGHIRALGRTPERVRDAERADLGRDGLRGRSRPVPPIQDEAPGIIERATESARDARDLVRRDERRRMDCHRIAVSLDDDERGHKSGIGPFVVRWLQRLEDADDPDRHRVASLWVERDLIADGQLTTDDPATALKARKRLCRDGDLGDLAGRLGCATFQETDALLDVGLRPESEARGVPVTG